jgi:protein phosphatase PTC1
MEDAHAFVYDFGGVKGQGLFSIFDGHAGKHAAEWCGQHFHEVRQPSSLTIVSRLEY